MNDAKIRNNRPQKNKTEELLNLLIAGVVAPLIPKCVRIRKRSDETYPKVSCDERDHVTISFTSLKPSASSGF